jgi:hypothetical protein
MMVAAAPRSRVARSRASAANGRPTELNRAVAASDRPQTREADRCSPSSRADGRGSSARMEARARPSPSDPRSRPSPHRSDGERKSVTGFVKHRCHFELGRNLGELATSNHARSRSRTYVKTRTMNIQIPHRQTTKMAGPPRPCILATASPTTTSPDPAPAVHHHRRHWPGIAPARRSRQASDGVGGRKFESLRGHRKDPGQRGDRNYDIAR